MRTKEVNSANVFDVAVGARAWRAVALGQKTFARMLDDRRDIRRARIHYVAAANARRHARVREEGIRKYAETCYDVPY